MGGSIMHENEIIGITGVFVLTFCLIALYHLMSNVRRHSKRYDARTKQINKRNQDWRTDDLQKSSGQDDAWLLWSPELDERAGPSNPGLGAAPRSKGLYASFVRIVRADDPFHRR
jgi:hypothetical protein